MLTSSPGAALPLPLPAATSPSPPPPAGPHGLEQTFSNHLFSGPTFMLSWSRAGEQFHTRHKVGSVPEACAAAAAAAAKSLQSYPTLCDPIDGSPPGSPVPGILQERTLEWVSISFSNA